MNYKSALEFVHSRPRIKNTGNHSIMLELLNEFDNPQDKLKFIHISGTNGKGSCAVMCTNVLKEAGYKTGMNISPYVIEFRERIQINGEYIPEEIFAEIVSEIYPLVENFDREEKYLSEFELVTAIAFIYYEKEKCDFVCLEVGLGGLNDCTNIIKNTVVACIMNIAFDHTRILGDTLSKIAFHKAGIIKKGCTVISYPAQSVEALEVIKKVAQENGAKLICPESSEVITEKSGFMKSVLKYKEITLNQAFTGIHQSYNATVVIETMKRLNEKGYLISDENIVDGIENTVFPARIEVIKESPLIILDGGHNIDGVTALVNVLRENELYGFSAVWASLSDKEPEKIIEILSPHIETLYTIELEGNKRALTKDNLAKMANGKIKKIIRAKSVTDAIDMAIADKCERLLVCGSLYLASEAREHLLEVAVNCK